MISLSNITAGLVLGLVVTSALPALGASRAVPPGNNARAQAITLGIDGDGTVSPNRARALRECNDRIGGLREHAWASPGITSIAPAWPSAARLSEAGPRRTWRRRKALWAPPPAANSISQRITGHSRPAGVRLEQQSTQSNRRTSCLLPPRASQW
jgi:hypothetical protein